MGNKIIGSIYVIGGVEMNNDVALEYNAKIIEVKDNIEQLKILKMRSKYFHKKVEEIEKETDLKVKQCYDDYFKADSDCFFSDILINIYTGAIQRLDRINEHIISYENYYKIQIKCEELKQKLINTDNTNIHELVQVVLALLLEMKKTSTIDYEEEKKIVEEVYKLVYKVIKLELLCTNHSTLLERIKTDNSDISYIAELIKKDIKNLKEEDQTKELRDKVREIDEKGFFDIHYLNQDLIILLSKKEIEDLTDRNKKKFLKHLEDYQNTSTQLTELEQANISTNNRIAEIKKANRNINTKRALKKIILTVNMGLVGTAIWGSSLWCREHTQETEYKTTTTIYDTSTEEMDTTIEYLPDMVDNLSLIEYSQWEEPGYFRDDYKRNVYTYQVNNLEINFEDIKEYLTSDIKDDIDFVETVEVSNEEPVENYEGNRYIITKTVQDKSDYYKVDNKFGWILGSICCSIGIISLDSILLLILSKIKLKELKYQKRQNKTRLKEEKQLLLETHTHVDELTDELFTLKKNIETEYNSLPKVLKKDNEIKEKILQLKNDNI